MFCSSLPARPSLRNFYELGDERTPYLLFDRNFPHLAAHFVGSNDVHGRRDGDPPSHRERPQAHRAHRRTEHQPGPRPSARLPQTRSPTIASPCLKATSSPCDHLEETGVATGLQGHAAAPPARPERPDAVFCYNDPTAIGAIEAVIEAGLRVPEDIAIIGCGNIRYNDYLRVPLSSIDHGTAELGRIAGELALDLANKPEQSPRSILVPPTLVVRAHLPRTGTH